MGRVTIGGLAHRSHPPIAEMGQNSIEQTAQGASDRSDSIGVRPEQPRPDRSLVVGAVPTGGVAAMSATVGRIVRSQRAQTERRQQRPARRIDHRWIGRVPVDRPQRTVRQAVREELVGPQRRVVAVGIS